MVHHGYTRFERARILGARALQISMGAPAFLRSDGKTTDPLSIALDEFERGLIPITPRRIVHDNH